MPLRAGSGHNQPDMPPPDVSTPARRTAVNIEDTIRHDAIESAALIDQSGTRLVLRKGHNSHVHLTQSELSLAAGATFTHNHPDGFGPSIEDVDVAAQFGFKELRVVTADHRYGVLLLSPSHRWPLSARFAAEESGAMQSARDDVRKGLLNPNDFSREVRHRTWLRLASALGFDYWREQS